MKFRGLTENKRTRQYEVFSSLDSHVRVPVIGLPIVQDGTGRPMLSLVSSLEFREEQYPNTLAVRSWQVMARQFDPELRRAEL